jgi:RimJ/RimL family protein N-acetyltransferase
MEITKYGISLKRLCEEDIELVRQWRNSQQINQFMEYREQISPEMQKKWFKSIDNADNYFFIIEYKGEKIGLVSTNNVDKEKGSSDGGIFIWDKKYYETFVPVWASLTLLESNFAVFRAQKSFIKVLKTNKRAQQLNLHLGYQLMPGQEEIENQNYELNKERFLSKSKKLRIAAQMLASDQSAPYYVFFDQHDKQSGLFEFMDQYIDRSFVEKEELKPEGKYFYIKPFSD